MDAETIVRRRALARGRRKKKKKATNMDIVHPGEESLSVILQDSETYDSNSYAGVSANGKLRNVVQRITCGSGPPSSTSKIELCTLSNTINVI